MSSLEDKEKHSRNRKRNIIAKHLRDPGDHKGAFALKINNAKKQEYKREKLTPRDVDLTEEYDND